MNKDIINYYTYCLIFKGDAGNVSPILEVSNYSDVKKVYSSSTHLFDESIMPVMDAVEFCLHLPRTEMDTYDTPTEVLDLAWDVPHNIIVISDEAIINYGCPNDITIAFYCEEVDDKAIEILKENNCSVIGVYAASDICQKLLVNIWETLYESRRIKKQGALSELQKQYIIKGEYQLVLPALFTARQYNRTEYVLEKIYQSINVPETCLTLLWNQRVSHNRLMYCKGCSDEEFVKKYEEGKETVERETQINVVIVFPGVSRQQIKYAGLASSLPENERRVLRLVGLHRAVAKDAYLIELPFAEKDLFERLNELEIHCKEGTNNQYVNRALRDIGKLVGKMLSKEQVWAINHAKHITVFSDYPLGLAILEDSEMVLQSYSKMSYRPLSPLTRCFQSEMLRHRQISLNRKCKIIFAECIPNNSQGNAKIRHSSKGIIEQVNKMGERNPKISIVYKETQSVSELIEFIIENQDADILHISAHGYYNRETNIAGLVIGNEVWMANDNGLQVPPIVVLSACHVSPRGNGCVSVADLFMRIGAEAVLGTFIPISANRNAALLTRFYVYISEAQEGSKQYNTLLDCWAGVTATNVIVEMMYESNSFSQWIMGNNKIGINRFHDFTLNRSKGRLHGRTMVTDTCTVLNEMLQEEGMAGKFSELLERKDFFPEMYFYQWIGFPENIYLYQNDL